MTQQTPQQSGADAGLLLGARPNLDAAYTELRRTVRAAGLLQRAYWDYTWRGAASFLFLAVGVALAWSPLTGLAWSALIAVLFAIASVQIGLMAHDAGHQAIFRRFRANQALGQFCFSLTVGIGFWYWVDRHNRHHAHTNDAVDDPDLLGTALIAFTEEDALARQGWRRGLVRHQGALSPILLVFALGMHIVFRYEAWRYTLQQLRGPRRNLELLLLALNPILWLLPSLALGWRWLLITAIGQMLAGLYLSLVVAPNHKGMPVWTQGTRLSFVERQVLSSRNITANPVYDFLYGGLNYQIEHHLFPTAPRAHLRRLRQLVTDFCTTHRLSYDEVNPLTSYYRVLQELRRIGAVVAQADQLVAVPAKAATVERKPATSAD